MDGDPPCLPLCPAVRVAGPLSHLEGNQAGACCHPSCVNLRVLGFAWLDLRRGRVATYRNKELVSWCNGAGAERQSRAQTNSGAINSMRSR